MTNEEERIQWEEEAEAVIHDIKDFVRNIIIASDIQRPFDKIYLNLTTLENNSYCIELSVLGFRVVGESFSEVTISTEMYYETPYAMLSVLSPSYNLSFSNKLIEKLDNLQSQT